MKRELFLSEIMESILFPYEASKVYEEQIVGEFENKFEAEYFSEFLRVLKERGLILDLACGDGRHTLRLSENVDNVIALDVSPNNLRMAKNKCQNMGNITFIRGSMFELPFRENTFDGIWFSQAFEYVPPDKRESILASLRHVLKSEGILYMSVETWMYPSIWASFKELWGDFKLYFYWKFIKRKPLLWGEFLYYLSSVNIRGRCSGWHYHVHTDKWTLKRLLHRFKFELLQMHLHDGYIYTLVKATTQEPLKT
jgi:SAM-dependent methyltransferase